MKRFLVFLCAAACASATHSQELTVPYSGSVQQVGGNGGMTWTCSPLDGMGAISCSFVQVSVSKPTLPDRRDEASKLLTSVTPAECAQVDDAIEEIERKEPQDIDEWARDAARVTFRALQGVCETQSLEAALDFVDAQQDIDRRTCNVSSWPFSLEFSRSAGGDKWDAINGPAGSCGVVKFVSLVPDYSLSRTLPFWNFRQRSVVTNPDATAIDGRRCSEWPEETMEFSWRTRPIQLHCEFVKHGLF